MTPSEPSAQVLAAAKLLASAAPFWSQTPWEDIPPHVQERFFATATHAIATLDGWKTVGMDVDNPSATAVDLKMARILLAVEIERAVAEMGNRDLLLSSGGLRHLLVRWAQTLRKM